MAKFWAILGSAIFFVVAPLTVAGLIPLSISGWQLRPPLLGLAEMRTIGAVLVVAGLVPLLESFGRFAWVGLGTPAPIAPTQHLVVSGFYRYVRNPMYVGVVTIILGQTLVLGDVSLLIYGAVVWLAFHLFVLMYEEPTLRATYGEEYKAFRDNVPRWIPRLSPWKAAQRSSVSSAPSV
jgi:protein-S-isoprenylcysteine O-methyltransferase Ste14